MEAAALHKHNRRHQAPVGPFPPRKPVHELALSTVTDRRFCDQQEMSLHTATGRSLPYEMVRMRCGSMPREARYSRTVWARRAPSAMLYSRVPRSSAWPSMVNE